MLSKNWIVMVGLICAIIVMALVSYKRSLLQLPRKIVIATGSTQGYYYKLGNEMKRIIEKEHPKAQVEILPTQGSYENLKLIERGEAYFAFYQNSGDTTTSIRSVANLYSEALHLIVKNSSGITSIKELKGKTVAIGSEGSGTRLMALEVLKHYGIELNDFEHRSYGLDELDAMFPKDLQAAFIVMRVLAPGLLDLFRKHEDLQLVPIEYSEA
ncbi:TPA: TAXI family TRAP transporter solute-binding subunit, partial [Candidatus Poribacteria bacterium]|nr:TAXI family TRAP transporter solute-binding subunit [Candidatus Poribacteria bacterium]